MDRLDSINTYFTNKERARLNELIQNTGGGLPTMTKDEIRLSCIENDGYEAPELNDKLYLHFRGFKRIENLEQYTQCKAIWLESNGFEIIENLGHMPLRCLYLSKNLINVIQGLDKLTLLVTLDLSNNRITSVSGLAGCASLKTINLSRNALKTPEALEGLVECPSLDNIDITNNNLEGDITHILAKLPNLHAVSVAGNPCTQTQAFRKRTIYAIPTLSYLDRPIDEIEKIGAKAFVTEGPEKEQEVRSAFIAAQKQARSDELLQFRTWQREELARRRERKEAGDTTGMHLITEFTQEEKAHRELEAQKAADLEKEMLEMGIGKIGQKYWQMQSRADRHEDGVNILEKAVEELRSSKYESNEDLEEKEDDTVETEDIQISLIEEVVDVNDDSEVHKSLERVVDEKFEEKVEEHVAVSEVKEQFSDNLDDENADDNDDDDIDGDDDDENVDVGDDIVNRNDTENEDLDVSVLSSQEESGDLLLPASAGSEVPQWVHQQRVQESIEIYQRQRNNERLKKEASLRDAPNVSASTFSSTQATVDWTFEASKVVDVDGATSLPRERKVFWTEWMDLKLAELVQSCVYDFSAIARAFAELANSDEFLRPSSGYVGAGKHSKEILESLSSDDCRLRWAELDARLWSAEDGVTQKAVYKICVQPDVLGKGHGAQPSFAAMSSQAVGLSAYLKVPTSFPAVSDDDDDDPDVEAADERFETLD